MNRKKVTIKQYNKYMNKIMDEVEGFSFYKQLAKITEVSGKYEIYKTKCVKKHKEMKKSF